jgi:hypothetical protein
LIFFHSGTVIGFFFSPAFFAAGLAAGLAAAVVGLTCAFAG